MCGPFALRHILGGWLRCTTAREKGHPELRLTCTKLHPVCALLVQLTMAKPKEIPALLPGLLSCIRMIWNLSKFYNTEERLTGLLRKISNEVRTAVSKVMINNVKAKVRCSSLLSTPGAAANNNPPRR